MKKIKRLSNLPVGERNRGGVSKELGQDGRGVKRTAQRTAEFLYRRAARSRASKVAVAIVDGEGEEPAELERWSGDEAGDVRKDTRVETEILQFLLARQVKSVVKADRIIGCPHEEGIDYPDAQACPQCPFW